MSTTLDGTNMIPCTEQERADLLASAPLRWQVEFDWFSGGLMGPQFAVDLLTLRRFLVAWRNLWLTP